MEIISTSQAPQPKVPLSQAVKSGNLVFVSGITPFTLTLELAVGDFDHVLKTTVILARRDDWRRMNEIYSVYFPSGRFPARTAYGAPLPHPDFLVEVECVAEVN
jgi:2-iminobutanoate/2-iminopropanoate deaminase